MKYWLYIFIVILFVSGCGDSDSPNGQESKIFAVIRSNADASEANSSIDIAWFNPKSKEIKFSSINSEPEIIPTYSQIDIKLENEILFTIVAAINGATDRTYDDLVLFYDAESSKYYLFDNWPDYWSPETTEINRQKRMVNWNRFLKQLKKEGKLKS